MGAGIRVYRMIQIRLVIFIRIRGLLATPKVFISGNSIVKDL
jgi:hypothetical protein